LCPTEYAHRESTVITKTQQMASPHQNDRHGQGLSG
jgi:hypothetical protein